MTQARVVAHPCKVCGEERITQILVTVDGGNGIRIQANVLRQCGCPAVDIANEPTPP